MQIVECTKRNSGDTLDRGQGDVSQFQDRQVEEWDIVVDLPGASSTWIIANAPLPNQGSTHPDNGNLICTGQHQIRRVDGSPIHFQATVSYEGLPAGASLPDPGEGGKDGKPEQREREPYSKEWSTVETEEPIDVDLAGDPICTINGEQFDPPLTETVYDVLFVESYDAGDFQQSLMDAVGSANDGPWKGYQAGQALLKSVHQKWLTDPKTDDTYWRITNTVQVRVKKDPNADWLTVWDKRIRAEGYKVKVGDNIVNAKDEEGNPSATPVLHDKATGEQIDRPEDAQWYVFPTKPTANFTALNIG